MKKILPLLLALLCIFNTTAFAQEETKFIDKFENATNIRFADFGDKPLCSLTFYYYCEDLAKSIIFYITDEKTQETYFVTTNLLDNDIISTSAYYMVTFNIPYGEYTVNATFLGHDVYEEGIYTYIPSSYLLINNQTSAFLDIAVSYDESFLYRAKNIILLKEHYKSIADNALFDCLNWEQQGRPITDEDIYEMGVVTQYNAYKNNEYIPKNEDKFEEITSINDNICDIDPDIDVYIEYNENMTNPSYIEQVSKEEAERTTEPLTLDKVLQEYLEEQLSLENEKKTTTSSENSTTLSGTEEETTTSKIIETIPSLEEESSSINNSANIKNDDNNTLFILSVFAILILVTIIVFLILKKADSKKSNK